MKTIKTKLTYYYFDISKKEQKKKYILMCNGLKEKGYKLFDSISLSDYKTKTAFFDKIKTLEKKGIVLDCSYIFNNQWNTTEESFNLRVFDWSEEIYPNKDIKEGYFLEVNKAMKDIRNKTFICGFCGKYYTEKEHKTLSFCNKCLSSEYLKKDELFLLRLKRISDKTERLPLNDCDKKVLISEYEKEQKKGNLKRLREDKQNTLNKLKEEYEQAKTEYKGKLWLINNNVDIKNLIYYSHNNIFSFGWRNKLTFQEEQDILNKIERVKIKFPYKYEIKT